MPTSAASESCASTGSLAAGDAERDAAAEVVLGSDGPVCTSECSSLFALGTDKVAYLLGSGALFFFLAIVHCACTASTVARRDGGGAEGSTSSW